MRKTERERERERERQRGRDRSETERERKSEREEGVKRKSRWIDGREKLCVDVCKYLRLSYRRLELKIPENILSRGGGRGQLERDDRNLEKNK